MHSVPRDPAFFASHPEEEGEDPRRARKAVQGERKPESRKKWKMKAGWWGMAWEARGGGGSALGLQPGIQLGARLGTPVAQASLYVQCLK